MTRALDAALAEMASVGLTGVADAGIDRTTPVIFLDTSSNHAFLSRSAIDTKGRETMKWTDGKEYPVIKVEISSESHPHYTGKQKIMDTAGRIEKFKRRYTKKPADKK